jgi:Flp pilus assembly protein protease CpaA
MNWVEMLSQVELSPLRVGFVIWAIVIGVFDWRQHRIPNALLVLALVPAILVLAIDPIGLLGSDRVMSFLGLLIGFFIFIPGYIAAVSGAGDVKLSAVCGLLLGQQRMIEATLVMGVGLLAFAAILIQRHGWAQARRKRFPAGVAIAAGFLVAMLFPYDFV